jgi:hypothetical protein
VQEEQTITRILESLLQTNSVCKILRTLEEIDSQNKFDKVKHKNLSINNHRTGRRKQVKSHTDYNLKLLNYWVN